MNFVSNHRFYTGLAACAAAVAVFGIAPGGTVPASAQTKPKTTKPLKTAKLPVSLVIYRGDPPAATGLKLASWGSGIVAEDATNAFGGSASLKITTHGMYQGASLALDKPVDFAPYIANKTTYFRIAVLPPPPDPNAASGPAGGTSTFSGLSSGYPGGSPGASPGSSPGRSPGGSPGASPGTSPGEGGASGYSGYPGGLSATNKQVQLQKNRKLENLRVVLVTTSSKYLEMLLPLASAADDSDWKQLAIPVGLIPNIKPDDAQIKEIRVFGDAPAVLNVGSIGIVEDPSPLVLTPINDKTVQRGVKYQYYATCTAGVTPLVYSWDWDASDGIQDETQGSNVVHVFRKASVDDATNKNTDFVVTLTVKDLYGVKAPATTSFKVHVTP